MLYFLQGLTVGLAYSAPIGMQNLFIINSALNSRRRRAFLTALIVAFFDIVLSLACFFGVGAVMQRFVWLQQIRGVCGPAAFCLAATAEFAGWRPGGVGYRPAAVAGQAGGVEAGRWCAQPAPNGGRCLRCYLV